MANIPDVCPTCGAPLPKQLEVWDFQCRTFIGGGVAVRFSKLQAKIFNAIWHARHSGGIQTREALTEIVYANDVNGGPIASCNLSQYIRVMRQGLRPTGYTITKNVGNPRVGYRLVKK